MSIANSTKDRVSPCFITCLHILHIHAYLDTTTYTTIQQLTSVGSSILGWTNSSLHCRAAPMGQAESMVFEASDHTGRFAHGPFLIREEWTEPDPPTEPGQHVCLVELTPSVCRQYFAACNVNFSEEQVHRFMTMPDLNLGCFSIVHSHYIMCFP